MFGETLTKPLVKNNTNSDVKRGGGSLMFWGYVNCKGNLLKIEMNTACYQKILADNVHFSA